MNENFSGGPLPGGPFNAKLSFSDAGRLDSDAFGAICVGKGPHCVCSGARRLSNFKLPAIYLVLCELQRPAGVISINKRYAILLTANEISKNDVEVVFEKAGNWQALEGDTIHSFWIKRCKNTHMVLANHFNQIMANLKLVPLFFTKKITYHRQGIGYVVLFHITCLQQSIV